MASRVPSFYRRIVAPKATSDFRNGTVIEKVPLPAPKNNEIVMKTFYCGINASDVNYIAGRYLPGQSAPFYPGFEAVGEVISKGKDVTRLEVGDSVALSGYECFADYRVLEAKTLIKVPATVPEMIPILVGGLTASIALEQVGEIKSGETVLVTAAAGGTGHFAVQIAKLAGCKVIGTCSSDDKVEFLKNLGCDRVINYKKENLYQVLKKEYPKGIDVVFECVGGEFFDIALNNLAIKGRLIVIGFISGYKDQSGWTENSSAPKKGAPLPVKLLAKSTSVRGFFLFNYLEQIRPHTAKLTKLIQEGKLKSEIDSTKFYGLESIADAVDYMYSGKNKGKVVVDLVGSPSSKL